MKGGRRENVGGGRENGVSRERKGGRRESYNEFEVRMDLEGSREKIIPKKTIQSINQSS